jgi:hypothetical protein
MGSEMAPVPRCPASQKMNGSVAWHSEHSWSAATRERAPTAVGPRWQGTQFLYGPSRAWGTATGFPPGLGSTNRPPAAADVVGAVDVVGLIEVGATEVVGLTDVVGAEDVAGPVDEFVTTGVVEIGVVAGILAGLVVPPPPQPVMHRVISNRTDAITITFFDTTIPLSYFQTLRFIILPKTSSIAQLSFSLHIA